jgi:phage baseplate assembly protein W
MAANQTVNIYGTSPPTQVTYKETQQNRDIFGLNFPLGANRTTGGFFHKSSGIGLIKDAVQQLLRTERGERILLPKFGCNLRKYLFQPLDETTFESIKNEILFSFNRYIVGAKIVKISVIPYGDLGPAGGNSLRVTLILKLLEEELATFDVGVLIK